MSAVVDDEGNHPRDYVPPPAQQTFNRVLVYLSALIALGTLVAFIVTPLWELAVATALLAGMPFCIATALRRGAAARRVRRADAVSPDVARAAARLHLQELGFIALTIVLFFAAGGAMALLD